MVTVARLFLALSVIVAPEMCAASQKAELQQREVYFRSEGETTQRQLTRDGYPKGQVSLSPDARKIAYVEYAGRESGTEPLLVVIDTQGSLYWAFRLSEIRDGEPCVSIVGLSWAGDSHLGVHCHKNPSFGKFYLIHLGRRAITAIYKGFSFVPSSDGKHVAFGGWVPHFSPPFAQSNSLWIDSGIVYPPRAVRDPENANLVPADPDGKRYRDVYSFWHRPVWNFGGTAVALTMRVADFHVDLPRPFEENALHVRWQLVVWRQGGQITVYPLHAKPSFAPLRWESDLEVSLDGKSFPPPIPEDYSVRDGTAREP